MSDAPTADPALAGAPVETGVASPLFVRVWNDVVGPKSEPFRHVLEGLALDALAWVVAHGPRAGERALDVGCGWGRSTRAMAVTAGPEGHVTGIDCTRSFVAAARRESAAAGLDNVDYVEGDAGCWPFSPEHFDVVASCEGVMFFRDARLAFAHLRALLRPGGRLVIAVPGREADNPWLCVPKDAARAACGLPPAGPTCGPGPFSLGDERELRAVLADAGFVDVVCRAAAEEYLMGPDVDAAIDLHLKLGPVGELVRLQGLDEDGVAALRAHLAATLAPWVGPRGVAMPASTWLVHARKMG